MYTINIIKIHFLICLISIDSIEVYFIFMFINKKKFSLQSYISIKIKHANYLIYKNITTMILTRVFHFIQNKNLKLFVANYVNNHSTIYYTIIKLY